MASKETLDGDMGVFLFQAKKISCGCR
jgi:hypothetical protein